MINIVYVAPIIIFCMVITYLYSAKYVKELRKDDGTVKDIPVLFTGFFFGGPALILAYLIFSEIRIEDGVRHYRFLICSTLFTIIQILLVVLLSVFGVISYEAIGSGEEVKNLINLLI